MNLLRQYFNCNEILEIFLTYFYNILGYGGYKSSGAQEKTQALQDGNDIRMKGSAKTEQWDALSEAVALSKNFQSALIRIPMYHMQYCVQI